MFPCSYAGVFTAVLAWTSLEIPLEVALIPSLDRVSELLAPQFAGICAQAPDDSVQCMRDLQWQVRAWIAWKCTEGPPAFNRSRAEESLLTFRAEIGETLALPNYWDLPDIDHALGLPPGLLDTDQEEKKFYAARFDRGPIDENPEIIRPDIEPALCSSIAGYTGGIADEVFVVGDLREGTPAARYRDYILRDLLGCIPASGSQLHVCVEPSAWSAEGAAKAEAECAELAAFSPRVSCGPCTAPEAPAAPQAPDASARPSVVMVASSRMARSH